MAVVIIIIGGTVLLAAVIAVIESNPYSATAIRLIGERFFANGTGVAYFDDGTMQYFNHTITPEKGYYYDNSTVFITGDIPGVSVRNDSILAADPTTGAFTGSSVPGSKTVNVTIPYGASLLPGNQTFQPNIVKVNVGDTIRWNNEDWNSHTVISPPQTYNSEVPEGMNFNIDIPSGDSAAIAVTRPGGFHYNDRSNLNATGAIIIK
jgi:plastocyanin